LPIPAEFEASHSAILRVGGCHNGARTLHVAVGAQRYLSRCPLCAAIPDTDTDVCLTGCLFNGFDHQRDDAELLCGRLWAQSPGGRVAGVSLGAFWCRAATITPDDCVGPECRFAAHRRCLLFPTHGTTLHGSRMMASTPPDTVIRVRGLSKLFYLTAGYSHGTI